MSLSRIIEELFPFPYYILRKRRQRQRCESDHILTESTFSGHSSLSASQLTDRLKEEHQRASAIDDKTFKLTLSLSVGLTVLGFAATLLVKTVSSQAIQTTLTIIIAFGLFYVLAAGFVALGALRTSPSYGYGTLFMLQQQGDAQNALADALARQEASNNIRHLRNETAFQALRNGLLLLFAAILLFVLTLAFQPYCFSADP